MSFTTDMCAEIQNMILTAHISKHIIVPKCIMEKKMLCYLLVFFISWTHKTCIPH